MFLKENLEYLLYKHNLTITGLARRTEIPKSTLHNWICGVSPKDTRKVHRLAKYFDMTIDELLFQKIYGDSF